MKKMLLWHASSQPKTMSNRRLILPANNKISMVRLRFIGLTLPSGDIKGWKQEKFWEKNSSAAALEFCLDFCDVFVYRVMADGPIEMNFHVKLCHNFLCFDVFSSQFFTGLTSRQSSATFSSTSRSTSQQFPQLNRTFATFHRSAANLRPRGTTTVVGRTRNSLSHDRIDRYQLRLFLLRMCECYLCDSVTDWPFEASLTVTRFSKI
jgi:hypothetical protein